MSYQRWFFTATGVPDELVVEVSNDGGTEWVTVETTAGTGSEWEAASFIVGDHVTPTSQVAVRFTACDCPNDSVTEAGIDDFHVERYLCVNACPWDLDGDGQIGIGDFLIVIGGWGTPAGDVDGDGDTGISDFLALLGHWGPCP